MSNKKTNSMLKSVNVGVFYLNCKIVSNLWCTQVVLLALFLHWLIQYGCIFYDNYLGGGGGGYLLIFFPLQYYKLTLDA